MPKISKFRTVNPSHTRECQKQAFSALGVKWKNINYDVIKYKAVKYGNNQDQG